MPNRILRPGILTSERVDALTSGAEIFYRRLMSIVDDFGRFDADPRVLRASCFPLRVDGVTIAELNRWLNECATALSSDHLPLLHVYAVKGKRYLQLTDFGQRIRPGSQSKIPAWPEGEEEFGGNPPPSAAERGGTRRVAARATTPSPSPSPTTSPREGSAEGNQPLRPAFDQLAAAYPKAGRTRIESAFDVFAEVFPADLAAANSSPTHLLAEMLEGLQRWLDSEQWHAGKVHSIRTFIAERLWREDPLSAADALAKRPTANGKPAAPGSHLRDQLQRLERQAAR